VLCFPLMLLAALAVLISSPGPILYRQRRCGLYGRPFTLIKFRSMIDGTVTEDWARTHHPAWFRTATDSHKQAQKAQE